MSTNDITANRHGGNPESIAAFDRIADNLPFARKRVLDFVRSRGLDGATAQETADHFGVTINCVSGRFSELKKAGLIRKTGVRNGGGVCVATEGSN